MSSSLNRGESRAVQDRPEAIARAAEVLFHGRRVEAGIDAAEEDVEVRRDHVGQRLVRRRRELLLRRPQAAPSSAARALEIQRQAADVYFFDRPSAVSESIRYGEFSRVRARAEQQFDVTR